MENINIQPVLNAFITLLAAVITCVLVPYIKSKLTRQQQEKLLEWVRIAVSAAEQIFSQAKSGAEKKHYVQEFLVSKGYDVSKPEIDAMIEAAVSRINGVESVRITHRANLGMSRI